METTCQVDYEREILFLKMVGNRMEYRWKLNGWTSKQENPGKHIVADWACSQIVLFTNHTDGEKTKRSFRCYMCKGANVY